MKRRILSIITALALCLSLCPTWAFAAEGEPDTGLCDHHPEHIGCGYAAPTEGQPCGHVHTDECYAEETLCVHVHDESCYSDGLLPAEDEDRAAAACAHTCSVESGCVTRTLNCQHSHDSECGYVQSDPGTPCGYVCNLCPIEDLIAALPEQVTEDNAADVRAQLDEILALFGELTGEEQEQINLSHIYTLQGALDEANAPTAAEGAPTEQFPALTPGGTYWFDLSGAGIPGQVNTGNSDGAVSVPDTTLHWVPFTYAGTINAYVLNKSSSGQTGASNSASGTTDPSGQYGYTYDHSLFIADYNVTYTVSWNDLNGESMIFGTAYTSNGVGYTLRAPSVGNNYDSNGGVPKNNEWDGILDKNDGDIKNWSKIYSWGQDGHPHPLGSSYRAVRGYVSARDWNGSLVTDRSKNFGFRPVLELPAPDTLASDSLKVVTLNLNGGKIGSETGSVSIVVKSGGSFTAPGSEGLTRPDGSTGDFFCWLGSDGKAYRAKESVPANVTSLTAQWEKITPTVTPPTAISSLTYTGEAQALISAGSTSGGELQYSTDNSTWSASIPTGTEVNTYTVYYKVVGDDIYTDVAAKEIPVSIGKATPTVTPPTAISSLTYTGEAQALISAGSTSGGELQYSTDNSTWSASIPTGTEVNTYTVYYKVVGDDSYTDVAAQEISVSIGKASTSVTAAPTATGITYGEALSDSALTDGEAVSGDTTIAGAWNWTAPATKPNAGTAQYEVTFTPDNQNYNTAKVNVSVTVAKATPTLTAPTASAIQYGQKLSDSTLTGGTATNPNGSAAVAGTWSWASGNTRPTATGDFPAAFVPSDTANYNTPENVDTSVTVNPAAPKITLTVPAYQVANGVVEVKYTAANPHDATLNDLPAVTLTYKVGSGAEQPITDGKFTIPEGTAVDTVITVTASTAAVDGKYTAAAKTATVTVTDKTPVTISGVSVTGRVYNGQSISYSGTPVIQTLDGTAVTDATVTYTWNTSDGTAPVNAGSYTLTISVGGEKYIGSTTVDFTISKASITITADDKQADVGTAKPDLTYTVTGLASGDTLTTEPTLVCDADMNTIGQYPITASGAAVPSGGNYNEAITYVPGTLRVTDPTISVTGVTLNKTSTTLTVGGSERLTATVAPSDATDKSVTWTSSNTAVATVDSSGNVTAIGVGTATITVTTADGAKTAACAVTVSTNSGGGGGGGGGGTTSTPGSSTVTVPVSGEENTVHVSASVSGTTATVSKIDTTQIDHVVGENGQASMVEIDFTGLGKTIDTVKLPTAAIKDIAAKAQNEEVGGLTVKLPEAEISFDANALSAIQAQAGSQITLTVTPAKSADLNSRQKEAVGNAPVFNLTLRSGSGAIVDFKGGYATVSLPYTLTAGQNPSGVVVYYLDDSGNITPCTTMYDVSRKSVIFTTGHFSLYFVGYDPAAVWVNPFSDVAEDAWYYDAVRYASENGLMGGYGNGRFGPDDNLSRAQFAQILFNKEGRPVVNYLLQYGDVATGAWYTEAVRWATSQGIVGGYGNGMFGPNDNITREQLAVMLWRYAGSPAATEKELHFTDADKASVYALEALRWAVENGIINGKGGGILDPKGQATRAQVAQMLKNYLER